MKYTINRVAIATLLALTVSVAGCSKQTAEDHLIAAEQFIEAKNMQAAILELKSAIQLNPKSAEARFKLGLIYQGQNRYESAEKELNKALELGYSATEILPLLTVAYRETGASNALSEVSHTNASLSASENAKIGLYKLTALVDLQKNAEASQLIFDLQKLDTSSVYKGLATVYTPILNEDYETALELIAPLEQQAPLNEDVLRLYSKLLLVLGKKEEATERLAKLYSVRADSIEVQFTYLAALMDLQRYEKAEPIVDNLLPLDTENGVLNQFKGTILASQEKFADSLVYLKKALANGRDSTVVRLLAGFSAYRIQNFEEAVLNLGLVADSLPGNHPGLRVLADSQLKLGQNKQASETLMSLENKTQQDATLFSRAGFQLISEGNVETAKQVVNESEEIDATSEELMRLGVLQLSLNDLDGLLKLEEAVKLAPESASIQQTLASAYLLAGQTEKAAELAKTWKQQQPEAFEPYILEGELAQNAKQWATAKASYEQAKAFAPDNEVPKLALANLQIAQGNIDDGVAALKAILAEHPDGVATLSVYYTVLANKGDASDAIQRTKSALDNTPDNLNLRMLMARMQFQLGDFASTLNTLESLAGQSNLPVLYWQMKGQSLLRTNALKQASEHYLEWKAVAPFNKDAVLGVLLTMDIMRQFEPALAVANEYVQQRPDKQIDILRAYFNIMVGNKDETKRLLSGVSSEQAAVPFVRGIKARLAVLEGRFADAVDDAKAAYENRQNIRNLLIYIRALENSDNAELAFETLKNFAEAQPDDQRAKLLLAERLISRDRAAAMVQYAQSLEALPDNFLALNNLAYLYYEDEKYEDAQPLAERAVELRPSSPEAVDTLAQILIAKGELKRARILYDNIVVQPVSNDEVIAHFIELLVKMGDTELAQRRLTNRNWSSAQFKQLASNAVNGNG